jgi:hypothetical protein
MVDIFFNSLPHHPPSQLPLSPVQLEGVGAVAVGGVAVQVLGQVDDHDGLKGAFLRAAGGHRAERREGER